MSLVITQVDAFTDRPFAGNPAAVCILPAPREDRWLQAVASEMNLSETAFLIRQQDGYNLRWFTPTVEVDLCGHATLASAHVLWETGQLGLEEQARFHTRSGLLSAKRAANWIEMDFPANPPVNTETPDNLAAALGAAPRYVGRSRFDLLVEVDSEQVLRSLKPDITALAALPARGIIVTCRCATPEFDFLSRFFAPASGVAEDPVTGSAHCCLGPYWRDKLGKEEMLAYQASPRGGVVRVRVVNSRVLLGGKAITVLRGALIF
jgi:PhzF family phenazine biosynthesis protein